MIRLVPLWPLRDRSYGWSTSDGTLQTVAGMCCRDHEGRRKLALETHLLQQNHRTSGHLVHSVGQIHEIFFDVRPDLAYSQAGPGTSISLRAKHQPGFATRFSNPLLPRMSQAGEGLEFPVTVRALLPQPLQARPEAKQIQWPKPFVFDFHVYVCDALPPGTLRLGRNFLRHGITVWEEDVTHFIFLADNQEAYACRFDRVRLIALNQ